MVSDKAKLSVRRERKAADFFKKIRWPGSRRKAFDSSAFLLGGKEFAHENGSKKDIFLHLKWYL